MPLAPSSWHLRQVCSVVTSGGIIAYPTESVYGLGCDPLNSLAVERLLRLKQRAMAKGVILIAADFNQLKPYVAELPEARLKVILSTWPGPNTWLFPVLPGTPQWLSGKNKTIAVRVTNHPTAAALCRSCRTPLVSTSANLTGQQPAKTALRVQRLLGHGVDYIVHGETSGMRRPSCIRDGLTGALLRA